MTVCRFVFTDCPHISCNPLSICFSNSYISLRCLIWSFLEVFFLNIEPSLTRCSRQTPWQRRGLAVAYRTCGNTICSSLLNISFHGRKPQAIWANDCLSKIHFWTICGFVATLHCSFWNIISWNHVTVMLWLIYLTKGLNFPENIILNKIPSRWTLVLKS
jgi:hypothetical protein